MPDQADILKAIWNRALAKADPFDAVCHALPPRPKGRVGVIAVGKAAGRMAEAVEYVYGAVEGICVVPEGYERQLAHLQLMVAAHPVPRNTSLQAADAALALAQDLGPEDTLFCLISGGGSALLSKPAEGIDFSEKAEIVSKLVSAGARIQELNTVRKGLSAIKGGRLAAATKAAVHSLLISDVVGDDASIIASGPSVPSKGTVDEVMGILARYGITLRKSVEEVVRNNSFPELKPGKVDILLRPIEVLVAAAEMAQAYGYQPIILGDALEGDAFSLGQSQGGLARSIAAHGLPLRPPVAIISGGETNVNVRNAKGRGGRNTACAAGFLYAATGIDVSAIFADTDGIDGMSGGAGALLTRAAVRDAGAGVTELLKAADENDTASYLEKIGALFVTGPTCTNTNDLRIVLVEKPFGAP